MIRAASSNSSINDSIRRGQKRHTTEKLRANKERIQFRRLGFSSISNGSRVNMVSPVNRALSPHRLLLNQYYYLVGRREDIDEKIQTIDGQHVISHPRLVPPGWTVKISSTRNESSLPYWPLHCADLVPLAFPVIFQSTCSEPNDSEESEESEDEGMDEGANIDVPAEIVLNLIARGSNSGSTATLEDILRV